MKKLSFSILLSIIALSLSAQKGLEFGGYLQPQTYWILNDDDLAKGDELNYRFTYNSAIGLNAGYNFTNNLGLRSGFHYATQGQDYVNAQVDPDSLFEVSLTYFKVPLYLKYVSSSEARVGLMVMMGPQVGFLSKALLVRDENDEDDISALYQPLELSGVFAIGVQINIDYTSNINILFRGDYSLNNIGVPVTGRASSHNATAGLYVAYNYILNL